MEDDSLWAVTVAFEMVVYAKDEQEAREIATQNSWQAAQSEDAMQATAVRRIRTIEELPDGWEADTYPWGDSVDTCGDLLK